MVSFEDVDLGGVDALPSTVASSMVVENPRPGAPECMVLEGTLRRLEEKGLALRSRSEEEYGVLVLRSLVVEIRT